jgi:hypothetical protein
MTRAEANRLAQAATADLRRDIASHLRVLKAPAISRPSV